MLLSLSMVLGMLPFNTLADAISGITIDEINFPDDNFRQFLLSSVSGCEDGILTDSEIANITKVDCGLKQIKSLKGIDFFTELKIVNYIGN